MFDDVYVFKIPCSLTIGMVPGYSISLEDYKAVISAPDIVKNQEVLANKLGLGEFVEHFKNNNLCEVVRQENGPNEMMVYACKLVNGVKLVTEVIFEKATNSVNMRTSGPSATYLQFFQHALSMIVNL